MRPRLKVCCIASIDEARTAVAAGAHALGLVGEMPSGPGPISDEAIREIAAWAPPGVSTFLLTSRTRAEDVVRHVLATGVNTVQLVDDVEEGAYAALRREAPAVKIVQVIHVQDERAIGEARAAAAGGADCLLLDSGRPRAPVKELGGTGRIHDWSVSARIVREAEKPVFLAGGLNPANVAEAIAAVRPFGIDLCSGVRTNGRLDGAKLGALVAAMRAGD